MHAHPLFRQLLILTLITSGVLLSFRYLFPLLFPFLTAYVFIRLLFPVIRFLKQKWHFPGWLANSSTLLLFFSSVGALFLLLGQLIFRQLRLLFTNISVYHQVYQNLICSYGDRLCHCIDYYFRLEQGCTWRFAQEQVASLQTTSMDKIYQNAGKAVLHCVGGSVQIIAFLLIVVIGMIVLSHDMVPLHRQLRRNRFYPTLHQIGHSMRKTGLSYLRAQLIIITVNWVVCGTGLFLIQNPYFIILGLLISIFDAFPVLGSGMIFVPWGIYCLFQKQFYAAAILFTVYLVTVFCREILEAKLIGNGMGMLPFYTLASIYIGLELYGICGIFLGPFAVVLIRSIYEVWQQAEKDADSPPAN